MENGQSLTITRCPSCGNLIAEQDQFCSKCRFPLTGSDEEQKQFLSKRSYQKSELKELSKKTKNAQTTLYVLAGLFFVIGVIYYFLNGQNDIAFVVLITNLILTAEFLALGGWSKSRPVASIISGLVLYVLVQILSSIDDPANIFKGIIIKVVIIVYLIKGLISAMEVERIKKEQNIS